MGMGMLTRGASGIAMVLALADMAGSGAADPPAASDPIRTAIDGDFRDNRARMVETIVSEVRLTGSWIGKTILDPRVLGVMSSVPRHEFVPARLASFAYLNRPLPVGFGQTVSQPYIVALMTDLVGIEKGDEVLLLGIGGGYHAAIIADLVGSVKVVDMQPRVAAAAMNRLIRLGYDNVTVANNDPYFGWQAEDRKFDAIIVRQATDFIPEALIRQLKPGGRIVVPVGNSAIEQELILGRKTADGRLVERSIMPVRFTRLPGGPRI